MSGSTWQPECPLRRPPASEGLAQPIASALAAVSSARAPGPHGADHEPCDGLVPAQTVVADELYRPLRPGLAALADEHGPRGASYVTHPPPGPSRPQAE